MVFLSDSRNKSSHLEELCCDDQHTCAGCHYESRLTTADLVLTDRLALPSLNMHHSHWQEDIQNDERNRRIPQCHNKALRIKQSKAQRWYEGKESRLYSAGF